MHIFRDASSSPGKNPIISFPTLSRPSGTFSELALLHKELDDFLQSIGDQGYVLSKETMNEELRNLPDRPSFLVDAADTFPAELEGSKPPEINYTTKPTTLTERKHRNEKKVAASAAWTRLGSSTYYFVDEGKAVQK